jgi:hypothetical protein
MSKAEREAASRCFWGFRSHKGTLFPLEHTKSIPAWNGLVSRVFPRTTAQTISLLFWPNRHLYPTTAVCPWISKGQFYDSCVFTFHLPRDTGCCNVYTTTCILIYVWIILPPRSPYRTPYIRSSSSFLWEKSPFRNLGEHAERILCVNIPQELLESRGKSIRGRMEESLFLALSIKEEIWGAKNVKKIQIFFKFSVIKHRQFRVILCDPVM